MNAEELRDVIALATQAPSVHNTQPWRFTVHHSPAGEIDGLDVFADRTRSLEVIDPEGRDLHLSCGAAIEIARIAVRAHDHSCPVELLPDGDPDHLAHLEVGLRQPATEEERRLAAAVPGRYTAREPFDEAPIPPDLVGRLEGAAAGEGVFLRILGSKAEEVTLAVLLSHSDEIERQDARYEAELARWLHRPAGSGDGIPPEAVASIHERGSAFQLRELEADRLGEEPPVFGAGHAAGPPAVERPLVAIIGTAGDDARAWLLAGGALGRLLLEASAAGVQASPMTQVTEVASARAMLADGLGLVGHPQIVLRMGYAHGHPTAPRRPVDEVLAGEAVPGGQEPA